MCLFVCCVFESSVGWKEVLCTTCRSRSEAPVGRSGFPSLRLCTFLERDTKVSLWLAPIFRQLVYLALVTVACFFLSHEPPTRSTSKKQSSFAANWTRGLLSVQVSLLPRRNVLPAFSCVSRRSPRCACLVAQPFILLTSCPKSGTRL